MILFFKFLPDLKSFDKHGITIFVNGLIHKNEISVEMRRFISLVGELVSKNHQKRVYYIFKTREEHHN